jgi:hypothetical protein
VVTDSVGGSAFSANLTATVPAGQIVTSKVTDPNGNTSEYSGNLVVSVNDSDNDGMPNAYENLYGFQSNSAADAALDTDKDGMTNLQEFRAGTNPRDAQSRLGMSVMTMTAGAPQLSFQPVTGKSYRLEYSDNLSPSNWTFLTSIFATSSAPIQISDKSATGRSQRFYRIVVQQ